MADEFHERHESGDHLSSKEVSSLTSDQYTGLLSSVAHFQRRSPEQAMNRFQHTVGGSPLSHSLEHVGDLTHRIAEQGGVFGTQEVRPKVEAHLGYLLHPYGWNKESHEAIHANRRFRTENGAHYPSDDEIAGLLHSYTTAHSMVPAYNKPLHEARSAAISVGKREPFAAATHLKALQSMFTTWPQHMSQQSSVDFLRSQGR